MYVVRIVSIAVPVNGRSIGQADEIADAIELLIKNGYVVFHGKPGGKKRNKDGKPLVIK